MDEETRIEKILHKLMSIDIYMREFLGVDLKNMQAIRYHQDNVIRVGESSSEDWQESIPLRACQHEKCHQVRYRKR